MENSAEPAKMPGHAEPVSLPNTTFPGQAESLKWLTS